MNQSSIYAMGDLQKLEIPQLGQIKAIRLGTPNYCNGDERNWSKTELEHVLISIARKVIPVKKLSVVCLTRLSATVVGSAACCQLCVGAGAVLLV